MVKLYNITGTHIHYYMFCKRKLWLSLHNIDLQNLSQDVLIGKLIEENSFKRRSSKNKQILLDNIKIDYIDFKNNILYETKKSSLHINVAIMQMKYYLFLINDKRYSGVIEVPTERKKEYVTLTESDKIEIIRIMDDINIIYNDICPNVLKSKSCKRCAFYDFCYA